MVLDLKGIRGDLFSPIALGTFPVFFAFIWLGKMIVFATTPRIFAS